MSWEDRRCPCGGVKESETLLCPECELQFHDHPAMQAFTDSRNRLESRRHAAFILVTLSRKRGGALDHNRKGARR